VVVSNSEILEDKFLIYLPFANLWFVVNYFRHLICHGVRWCEVWIALLSRIRLIGKGYEISWLITVLKRNLLVLQYYMISPQIK